jgi:mono/diheme cytochrome c family protein
MKLGRSTGLVLALAVGSAAFFTTSAQAAEPGALTAQDAGRAIYKVRCETCHGINGKGTKGYQLPATGPALQGNPLIIGAPEVALSDIIRGGRTGAKRVYDEMYADMPSFDAYMIPDLRPLLAYLKGDMQQDQ